MPLVSRVPVWIRQKETTEPPSQSSALGQPIGQSYYNQERIRLEAQVVRGDTARPITTLAGTEEHSLGYLVFDRRDLRQKRVTLAREDMIVQIGEGDGADTQEYYLQRLDPFGYYTASQGHRYLKAHFTDLKPKYR